MIDLDAPIVTLPFEVSLLGDAGGEAPAVVFDGDGSVWAAVSRQYDDEGVNIGRRDPAILRIDSMGHITKTPIAFDHDLADCLISLPTKRLLCRKADDSPILVNLATGAVISTFDDLKIESTSLLPDGERAAFPILDSDRVEIWSLRTRTRLKALKTVGRAENVVPLGPKLVAIQIYDPSTNASATEVWHWESGLRLAKWPGYLMATAPRQGLIALRLSDGVITIHSIPQVSRPN